MTNSQMQIQAAFGEVLKELEETRNRFLADAGENPQNYEDIRVDDAYIWFIESFG